jgi:hypothetical protein
LFVRSQLLHIKHKAAAHPEHLQTGQEEEEEEEEEAEEDEEEGGGGGGGGGGYNNTYGDNTKY